MELFLLVKPVSAFLHPNVLYFESFLAISIFLYCYYQCKAHNNVSQTDRVRGAIPIVWTAAANVHYAFHQRTINVRLLALSLMVTTWGLRMLYYVDRKLTKRGTFQQDSRWSVLYTFIYNPRTPYIWELFVLFVVNMLQIASWFLMIIPVIFMVYKANSVSLWMDILIVAIFLFFFTVEAIADAEMLQFRRIKFDKMMNMGHSIRYDIDNVIKEKGSTFNGWKYDHLMTGLRWYCLHPNYFGEMGQWACVLVFGVRSHGVCWASVLGLVGYLSLCVKLYKLALVTEGILAYSYGSYYRYHDTCNRFIPWFPKEMDLDQSISDDNFIEETYLSEKLLIRLRRMDKYRIFHFKYDKKLTKD